MGRLGPLKYQNSPFSTPWLYFTQFPRYLIFWHVFTSPQNNAQLCHELVVHFVHNRFANSFFVHFWTKACARKHFKIHLWNWEKYFVTVGIWITKIWISETSKYQTLLYLSVFKWHWNTRPFGNQTTFDHLNTELVR